MGGAPCGDPSSFETALVRLLRMTVPPQTRAMSSGGDTSAGIGQ